METVENKNVLGERIKSLCMEKGISYYALSYKSTVPLTTLLHIIDGTTKNPGIFTITKICEGLDVTVKDFLDIEDFLC